MEESLGVQGGPTAAASGRRSILDPLQLRLLLVGWGLLAAVVTAVALDHSVSAHPELMPLRINGMNDSLAELNRGGPPLLGVHGTPYPGSDSFGIYLYVPLLAHWLGSTDNLYVVRWLMIASMCVAPLIYPAVFRGIFGRTWIGLLAAFGPVLWFGFANDANTYWGPGWTVLVCLPLLLLLDRRWGGGWRAYAALGGIMVLASWGSSIRLDSELAIAVPALLVVWRHAGSWRNRALGLVVVVLGSMVISTGLLAGVRAYRNHVAAAGAVGPEMHPTIWHNTYIGFGYLANPYGIHYRDESAYAAVLRVRPGTEYLGPGYGSTLRHLVFRLVVDHPGFVARTVYFKTAQEAKYAVEHFRWVFVLLPVLLLTFVGRRRLRRDAALVLVAAAVNLVPVILVMPLPSYSIGWISTWGVLGLVALGHLAAAVPDRRRLLSSWAPGTPVALAGELRRRLASGVRSPAIVGLTALMIAVAALSHVTITGLDANTPEYFYITLASELFPAPAPSAKPVALWAFPGRLPSGWTTEPNVVTAPDAGAVEVQTTDRAQGYQLLSPLVKLGAGQVTVLVDGRPSVGGITVGLLAGDGSHWLGTANYWDGQAGFGKKRMGVTVHLRSPTTARVVLANLRPSDGNSHWQIRNVAVYTSGTR